MTIGRLAVVLSGMPAGWHPPYGVPFHTDARVMCVLRLGILALWFRSAQVGAVTIAGAARRVRGAIMQHRRACPYCGQETDHLTRSDEFAMFAWCQVCFHVHVVEEARPPALHLDVSRLGADRPEEARPRMAGLRGR